MLNNSSQKNLYHLYVVTKSATSTHQGNTCLHYCFGYNYKDLGKFSMFSHA